jgi:hypothetical protein
MKKFITVSLFFILFMLCNPHAHSQLNRTNFSAGFGTYKLKSYKDFQEKMADGGNPFTGIRAVDMFPNYFNWMITQERFFNPNHSLSIDFSYLYTGGRNSLADYSGRYTLDLLANSYRFGLSYTHYVSKKSESQKLGKFLRLRSGWARTNFQIREQILVPNIEEQVMVLDFFSDSFFLEFDMGLTYDVTPYLSIHLLAGYEYEPDARLKSTEKNRASLNNENSGNVTTNWRGFRLRTGIGFNFENLPGIKN